MSTLSSAVDTQTVADRNSDQSPILAVESLRKYFPVRGGFLNRVTGNLKAVDDVSFSVRRGEVLGIVGESGCGKSTLARLIMHLVDADTGTVVFDGARIGGRDGLSVSDLRRQVQMVFQDSSGSLNPRMTVGESIAYAPRMHGASKAVAQERAHGLMDEVGLSRAAFSERYPHELSGGQRQRVNIARALALRPRLLILDESVSALDKSIEAQILNLLQNIKAERDLTYIFISHDLNVIEFVSDRIVVMYLGKIVETGPTEDICRVPKHPYTRALLQSKPAFDPRLRTRHLPLTGDPPSPLDPPSGCRFRTRCDLAEPVCASREPRLVPTASAGPGHLAACHACDPTSGHSRSGAHSQSGIDVAR
jgi:peptide/nickel transport system ATP-binding protein